MHTIPVLTADTHVHRLYAEYAGLPVGVVTQCVQHAGSFGQVTWQACPGPTWADKAAVYHEQHEECMFELLHRSVTRSQRLARYEENGLWGWLTRPGRTVLDFGGGLGLTASLLDEERKHVTYCDVDGPVCRFAGWYFQLCEQQIEVLRTPSRHAVLPAERRWDLVLAEHVLDCVPDPAATLERLARAVAPGGLLFVSLDPQAPAANCPMRRHVNLEGLFAGSAALRGMERVLRSDGGHHAFAAR